MNRRSFLQRTGLAAVAVWLTGKTAATTSAPTTSFAYSEANTKVYDIGSFIYDINPEDTPLLTMMGQGKQFKLEDWPNYKVAWIEDTLIPRDQDS